MLEYTIRPSTGQVEVVLIARENNNKIRTSVKYITKTKRSDDLCWRKCYVKTEKAIKKSSRYSFCSCRCRQDCHATSVMMRLIKSCDRKTQIFIILTRGRGNDVIESWLLFGTHLWPFIERENIWRNLYNSETSPFNSKMTRYSIQHFVSLLLNYHTIRPPGLIFVWRIKVTGNSTE